MKLNKIKIHHIQFFYHDNSAARYYNTGRMGDLSLTIARDARVVSDILVSDCGYP